MATSPTPSTPSPAPVTPAAAATAEKKRAYGEKLFVTASTHSQVNDLTGQRIPHGGEVKVVYDPWIEIQLAAGVISEVTV